MSKYRLTNHLHVVAIPAKEGSLFFDIPDIVYRASILVFFGWIPAYNRGYDGKKMDTRHTLRV